MTRPRRPTTADLIEAVFDAGTYVSWDGPPIQVAEPGSTYAAELAAAAQSSGVDEAIITGEGRIDGQRCAFIAGEFRFMAGSIGRAAAERVTLAFERATREQNHRGGRGIQEAPSALHHLPATPDHWRRTGLMGVARTCHRRGAAGDDRLPGRPGV